MKLLLIVVRRSAPQVIVNPAAYTAVDRAESEPDLAWAVNAAAPGILAEEARRLGAALVHFSTDYVFDGAASQPYTEASATHPLGEYGRSKLGGEQAALAGEAVWVFRTSWVYSNRAGGFANKVLEWARQQPVMRVVADQTASPTWCRALAEIVALALAQGRRDVPGWVQQSRGLYHLAGSGACSRYEWAREILALDPHRTEQVVQELQPALTAEFPTPAQRPLYTALDCQKFQSAFGLILPPWERALELALESNG
jgi:dTDP-4-dehydrorhamnose reductase